MPELITVVMADVPNSALLWEHNFQNMVHAVNCYESMALRSTADHGGRVLKSHGENDGLFLVFTSALQAARCAVELQNALTSQPWAQELPFEVRMAIHCGEAQFRDGDYFGPTVNRCARLRGAAQGGQILVSGAVAALISEQLPSDQALISLGYVSLKDLRTEEVWQLWAPGLPTHFAGKPVGGTEDRTNLPRSATSFIGRNSEAAKVRELIQRSRMVTLVGTGGTGKTRLALHVATEITGWFPDGVWLSEFASVTDASILIQSIMTSIGLKASGSGALEQSLISSIGNRSLLMVWDNCEHIIDTCAKLTERLLGACPNLKILCTSREPLKVPGEMTIRVSGLKLPDKSSDYNPIERLSEALVLFEERAQAVRPGFCITSENYSTISEICRRLDGIPLAIELAAARIRAMGPEQIATRLGDRFRLLKGNSRTSLPHHQTLRALIDWSYNLLSSSERTMLLRLCVFAGSWHISAAESICSSADSPEIDVLDLVLSLTEKSLVVCTEDSGRYQLLETIRQYAVDRLSEECSAQDVHQLRIRHAKWYGTQVQEAQGVAIRAHDANAWLSLDSDYDNIRAALEFSTGSTASEDFSAAVNIAVALVPYWQSRYLVNEGRNYCERLLTSAQKLGVRALLSGLLVAYSTLCWSQSDYNHAKQLATEARDIALEQNSAHDEATALYTLGLVTSDLSDFDEARRLFASCLAIYQRLGDREGIARSVCCLGYCAFETGDYEEARRLTEQGIDLQTELGMVPAYTRNTLGTILETLGDFNGAIEQYNLSYDWFKATHHERGTAHSLHSIGSLLIKTGDLHEGLSHLRRSAAIFRALGDVHSEVVVRMDTAGALVGNDLPQEALSVSRECIALCCQLGSVLTSLRAIRQHASALQANGRLVEAAFLALYANEKLVALNVLNTDREEFELDETFRAAMSTISGTQLSSLRRRITDLDIESMLIIIRDHDIERNLGIHTAPGRDE